MDLSSFLQRQHVPHLAVSSTVVKNKNSKGEPICDTPSKLQNFWAWFGNSKIVDRYKRPLVVHHGTKNGGFKKFDLGVIDGHHPGFFFSSSADVSNTYTGSASIRILKLLPDVSIRSIVQLNKILDDIQPVDGFTLRLREHSQICEQDDGGAHMYRSYSLLWDGGKYPSPDIHLGEYHPYIVTDDNAHDEFDLDELRRLLKDTARAASFGPGLFNRGVYELYLSMENPLIIDGRGARWDAVNFEDSERTISKIAHLAKQRGHDGLVVKRAIDTADNSDIPSTIFVAFYPHQIKAVKGNTGNFQVGNSDITA